MAATLRLSCSLGERRNRSSRHGFDKTKPTLLTTSEVNHLSPNDVNNGVWTYAGSVTPDSSNTEAAYSVDVSLAVTRFTGSLNPASAPTQRPLQTLMVATKRLRTFTADFCEESFTKDAITRNNADEITGTLSTFHDIRISMLTVNQDATTMERNCNLHCWRR